MNAHAGWGTDGLCVACGDDNSNPDVCDPRATIDALRNEVADLKNEILRLEALLWDQ